MSILRKQSVANREVPVSSTVPYANHVGPHVVSTAAGDVVTVFRISGIAHESADVEDLNSFHVRLNGLLKTIQSERITLWAHTIRQQRREYPAGEFASGSFAEGLNTKYRSRIMEGTMMVNELFLTVVYSDQPSDWQKLLARFDRVTPDEARAKVEAAIEALEDAARAIDAGLRDYGPARLGLYEQDGIQMSEPMEFFGFLLNGEWQPYPLPRLLPGQDRSIADILATSRPFFGREAIELRGMVGSRLGAMLAFKEYPSATAPGTLNILLSLPFEFVLTQSFRFIPRQAALRLLQRQQGKMVQSGDLAVSQVDELNSALDDLASSRIVMGEHHLSLMVFGEDMAELRDNLALARSNLSDTGAIPVLEDWGNEAAFWAQLPGNFKLRPRPAPLTSLNFAGFCSMHNYPSGLADGNQWGPATTILRTLSGTPYYFNFHVPPSKRRRGRAALQASDAKPDDRVPGNTMIIGPTGSGKTVIQAFLLAQLEKFAPTVFYYDKDRGMEVFIRAAGGMYSTIENGKPTGFNPFSIDPNPSNRVFLQNFVRMLIRADGRPLSPREEAELDLAIDGVLDLPFAQRRLSRLDAFLDSSDLSGIAARLARWINDGALAWVFDNEVDYIDPALHRINGFDVTEVLDNEAVREPVLMYLLHRQEEVIDGRRFVLGFDEGWKVLYDEWLSAYLENKLLTIRKQNGFVVFGTQNPSHVIKARIADTLVQQSVTQIYLGNPKASRADYIEGFKLSEREYELIKDVIPAIPGRGYFLVKQGTRASVCQLDLGGFDDELAVLSGTTATVELLHRILPTTGQDPAAWLPVFHDMRKSQ